MELKSVDGIETPDWDSVRLALVSKIGDKQTQVGVAPFSSGNDTSGAANIVQKTLDLRQWQFEPDKQDPVVALGIIPRGPQIESVLAEVQPGQLRKKRVYKQGIGSLKLAVNHWIVGKHLFYRFVITLVSHWC